MAARIREHDWEGTPLGPTDRWPSTLRSNLGTLLESPHLGVILWGPELRLLYKIDYAPALGDRHPHALGRPITEVWHDIWDQLAPTFLPVRDTGVAVSDQRLPLTMFRNGEPVQTYWSYSVSPIRDDAGDVVGLLNFATDITVMVEAEQRQAALIDEIRLGQRALAAANEALEHQVAERTIELRLYRDIVQSDESPVVAFDKDMRIIAFNKAHRDAYLRVYGIDQHLGESLLEQFKPEQAEIVRGFMARTLAGEAFVVREAFGDPDLEKPYWQIAYSPLLDERGAIIGGFHHALDITAELRAQESLALTEAALRQSQKMEAVGQLTGGLAHDFNNLLAGISGSLEMMQARLQQGRVADPDRYMTAAQGASKRAAALTHRLLAFSRRQTLDPRPTDVNRLVAGMQELIQRTVGPAIELEVVGVSAVWPTLVDPSQLENALLNLCINARDAMPEGGRITIETANKWLDDRAARQQDVPEGQYLSLCVTDTGTGMSPDVIERVFEPFFTTKPLGEGTGLGLSMIYGFAKQSGGQVRIYSEVGVGSTVCIYLPRHHGEADLAETRPATIDFTPADQSQTVLVVDDEPTVRMLVADILSDLGYSALEAADSVTGLKLLQTDARIDLLVTDVGLPGGMNGRQMVDAARSSRPDLKVLFITGYAENAVLGGGRLDPGMAVLTKPFAVGAMAARIRQMIEAE